METKDFVLPIRNGNMDDHEYAKILRKFYPPRVLIDNDSCINATVISVVSVNIHGILLEAVQVIADLHLNITKAYISSDGNWFMEVFHVDNGKGNKVMDNDVLENIKKALESDDCCYPTIGNSVGIAVSKEFTAIELAGKDRPGLLSDICAVLNDHNCNINSADVWSHNMRMAAVFHVTEKATGAAIEDQRRVSDIRKVLFNLVKGFEDIGITRTEVSMSPIHKEKRLHQMMRDDRNSHSHAYANLENSKTKVIVTNNSEKGYTIVTLRTKDRPKLLFDALCALADLQYVVHHGTVQTEGDEGCHEYCIKQVNGKPIQSEVERQHLIQCLRDAIDRRNSEGVELELKGKDCVGLLFKVTKIIREHGLNVLRTSISTVNGKVMDTFHVLDASGNAIQPAVIDSMRMKILQSVRGVELTVKRDPFCTNNATYTRSTTALLFGGLSKFYRPFQNFLRLELKV